MPTEEITAVYSSDLGRAHQTAQSIAEVKGVPVIADEGLRERSFGIFEGKTFDEIQETWPDHAHNWRKRIPEWQPPDGGESLLELRARVTRTMRELAARHPGEQIVVVAHGGVLDALYRIATGQEVQFPPHLGAAQRRHQPAAVDARGLHAGGLVRHRNTWTMNPPTKTPASEAFRAAWSARASAPSTRPRWSSTWTR